jgi:DNA-binding transcriptional ArsR family regulator
MPTTPDQSSVLTADTNVGPPDGPPDGSPVSLPAADLKTAALMLGVAAHPARLEILALVRDHPAHVGAVGAAIGLGQPATSHHLGNLRRAGLVGSEKDGQRVLYACTDAGRAVADVVGAMVGSK